MVRLGGKEKVENMKYMSNGLSEQPAAEGTKAICWVVYFFSMTGCSLDPRWAVTSNSIVLIIYGAIAWI